MEIVTADIGGTHARFAIATIEGGRVAALGEPVKLATADHASLQTAWEAFGRTLGRDLPRAAAIAIAAPIRGTVIKMTNNPWTVQPAQLDRQLGLDSHVLINDFAAVAHAVGSAGPEHFIPVTGPDEPLPNDGVVSVIGPGTGLGVAQLVRRGGRNIVIPTEGGHSDFAPLDGIEDRVLARLREQHGRVSVERVVAGPGLRTIYAVLAEIEGREMPQGDDRALWTAALDGSDSLAAAALERFCQCLGAVAGDIALTQGPGPVVIAGGLGLRLADALPQSGFAERFAAKGRYQSLMRSLPVKLITHPEPGLYGAAMAFAESQRA
ncbi:glucokinase [uncultured Parasphingopyxis sp.]|uniref:glucokinase n=1 Tax=uncultured Parasphingopyxis sp. TaxID=1547918 RepID=UPI0026076279|nr:glucokinase [uncultured Parasphingopyxis sp.]